MGMVERQGIGNLRSGICEVNRQEEELGNRLMQNNNRAMATTKDWDKGRLKMTRLRILLWQKVNRPGTDWHETQYNLPLDIWGCQGAGLWHSCRHDVAAERWRSSYWTPHVGRGRLTEQVRRNDFVRQRWPGATGSGPEACGVVGGAPPCDDAHGPGPQGGYAYTAIVAPTLVACGWPHQREGEFLLMVLGDKQFYRGCNQIDIMRAQERTGSGRTFMVMPRSWFGISETNRLIELNRSISLLDEVQGIHGIYNVTLNVIVANAFIIGKGMLEHSVLLASGMC